MGEMIDEMMRHAVVLKSCSTVHDRDAAELRFYGVLWITKIPSMVWILPTKKGIGAAVIGHF